MVNKLLDALGVHESIQIMLSKEILDAANFVYGLQEIYSKSPESPKKNQLVLVISESVKLLMQQIKRVQDEAQLNVAQVFTTSTTTTTTTTKPSKQKKPRITQPPQPPQPPKTQNPCEKYKDDDVTLDELKEALKLFNKLVKKEPELADEIDELKLRINCKQSTI
jgi:hypothetical protein